MKKLELAKRYLDIVFKTGVMEDLRSLLAEDLNFDGPFYKYKSANNYIDSLKKDPPKGFKYEIIKAYEDDSSVCLIYNFSKPGIKTVMSHSFEFEKGKIKKVLLVFDSTVFN